MTDKNIEWEFKKVNEPPNGYEDIHFYKEDGYLYIESNCDETHSFALTYKETEQLIEVLQNNLKETLYR